jgi:uncharacterized protein
VELVLVGCFAGVVAGMLGVGGGAVFVPALVVLLDRGQVEAEATSLLAIVPVALVGATNQRRYGNVRLHDALVLGVTAIPAAALGVVLVNVLPVRVVEVGFALLTLYVALRLVRRALEPATEEAVAP